MFDLYKYLHPTIMKKDEYHDGTWDTRYKIFRVEVIIKSIEDGTPAVMHNEIKGK